MERSWHSLGRSSIGWFNLTAAIRVKSRKPTGFVLSAIHKTSVTRIESTRPASLMATPSQTKLLFRWYTSNLQATMSVQISIQMYWDRLHALNPIAVLPTCLQRRRNPRFLLQYDLVGYV